MILVSWATSLDRNAACGGLWADDRDCLNQVRALWATGGCGRITLFIPPTYEPRRDAVTWVWVARPRRLRVQR